MNTTTDYRDSWINPRVKIAALWASMLFVFVYVDLFSLYRADVRADIEAGKMSASRSVKAILLGVIVYVALPSLMLFLSLVLPVKVTRMANIVLAVLYALTIAGSAVGEWNYFILGQRDRGRPARDHRLLRVDMAEGGQRCRQRDARNSCPHQLAAPHSTGLVRSQVRPKFDDAGGVG